MSRNEYFLCLTALGDAEVVGTVAEEYIGQQVNVVQKEIARKVIAYFAIYNGPSLTQEEQHKLQQLCRLQASNTAIQSSLGRLTQLALSEEESQSSRKQSSSSTQGFRPDTIRVKNVPPGFDKGALEDELQYLFGVTKATVHSLASLSSIENCATVTFPESTNDYIHGVLLEQERNNLTRDNPQKLQFDEDFLYITPLYDAGDEALIDIFVVPGLGTHQFGTFRAPEGDKMWLRDFLPRDIMGGRLRVLLYGYDSVVNDSTTSQGIHNIATTCLNSIKLFRRNKKNRPILFIGQCLGGLIIQELLFQASCSKSDEEREIFDMWGGFIGFGVPINGLDHHELIERAEGKPNEAMMRDICVDKNGKPTYALVQLTRNFETCIKMRNAEVTYFGESAVSSPRMMPGSPPKPERLMVVAPTTWILLTNTTHSKLVKFRDGESHYGTVKENIRDMAEKIVKKEAIKVEKEDTDNAASSSKTPNRQRAGKRKADRRQQSRDMRAEFNS